jgi:pilus assembly protein CpaC
MSAPATDRRVVPRTVGRLLGLCLLTLMSSAALHAARAQTPAPASTHAVVVPVGQGRLFRLNHDATNVLVADSAIADVQVVSPRLVYVYGRHVGETTLHATGADDGVDAALRIRVQRSADAAQSALSRDAAQSAQSRDAAQSAQSRDAAQSAQSRDATQAGQVALQGSRPPPVSGAVHAPVSLRFLGDQLVVDGPVANLGEAMEVEGAAHAYAAPNFPPLDRTQLAGTQQITLRVRIAEVHRQDLNNLGINWGVTAQPGKFTIGFFTNSVISGFSQGVSAGTAFGALGVGFRDSTLNANALINALAQEQIVTMLAEPNLTTMSGETASFMAGGEVPIPVPQQNGVTTVDYKRYGVSLAFTPTLLPEDRIAMRVRPQVSEIDNSTNVEIANNQVPAFTERAAETNVELASGQTIAIAGLFQNNLTDQVRRLPFLSDLPVIGALFRDTTFQRDQLELVILVTPYLSRPMSSPDSVLPTDELSALRDRPSALSHAGFVVN